METARAFLSFAFAAFRRTREDNDTIGSWLVFGAAWFSFLGLLIPTGNGSYMSVETFFTGPGKPVVWAVLVGLMFWGAFEKFQFEKSQKESKSQELAERVRKKFRFVYAWEDCLKHGVYSDKPEEEGLLQRAHTILRVGIKSESVSTIRDVTVKQARGRGNINPGVQVGQQFRRTHGDYSSFTLHNSSEPIVLIDLCQHDYLLGEDSKITFLYSNPVQFTISKASPFRIECSVILQGEDAGSVVKSFLITIDHSNSWWPITMEEMKES